MELVRVEQRTLESDDQTLVGVRRHVGCAEPVVALQRRIDANETALDVVHNTEISPIHREEMASWCDGRRWRFSFSHGPTSWIKEGRTVRAPTVTVGRQWGAADVRAGLVASYGGRRPIGET